MAVNRQETVRTPYQAVEELARIVASIVIQSPLRRDADLRGSDERTGSLFSYMDLEERVRRDHPLRAIRMLVNETLASMERDFAALYAGIGRPSIAPEKLLRAMLLQAFYSVRSERLLMERLEFDLLFRCECIAKERFWQVRSSTAEYVH